MCVCVCWSQFLFQFFFFLSKRIMNLFFSSSSSFPFLLIHEWMIINEIVCTPGHNHYYSKICFNLLYYDDDNDDNFTFTSVFIHVTMILSDNVILWQTPYNIYMKVSIIHGPSSEFWHFKFVAFFPFNYDIIIDNHHYHRYHCQFVNNANLTPLIDVFVMVPLQYILLDWILPILLFFIYLYIHIEFCHSVIYIFNVIIKYKMEWKQQQQLTFFFFNFFF